MNVSSSALADSIRWVPLGETAVLLQCGSGEQVELAVLQRIWSFAADLDQHPLPGVTECVTAYASILLLLDPLRTDVAEVGEAAVQRWQRTAHSRVDESSARMHEVPVCYDREFGLDLDVVAHHASLSVEQVIEEHSRGDYVVTMIGFSPGFPYLAGMSPRIAAPRRESPRLAVPAGSVGIAGEQTGIYPSSTPGGWQLIGRTPLDLFDPAANPPSRLQPGDRVRIQPISRREFERLAGGGG